MLLSHAPKLYFGNFYRAFKKSNNYVAIMLISIILMPFELWSRWGIHEQFGVFYLVKAFLYSSSCKFTTDRRYCSFVPPIFLWFQLINNHIKTWVWKSAETKLLTLKFFEILIKHHQETRVNTNIIRSSFWKQLAMTF